jgi:hypothetical protein
MDKLMARYLADFNGRGRDFPLARGHLRLIYAIVFMGSCLATWFFH